MRRLRKPLVTRSASLMVEILEDRQLLSVSPMALAVDAVGMLPAVAIRMDSVFGSLAGAGPGAVNSPGHQRGMTLISVEVPGSVMVQPSIGNAFSLPQAGGVVGFVSDILPRGDGSELGAINGIGNTLRTGVNPLSDRPGPVQTQLASLQSFLESTPADAALANIPTSVRDDGGMARARALFGSGEDAARLPFTGPLGTDTATPLAPAPDVQILPIEAGIRPVDPLPVRNAAASNLAGGSSSDAAAIDTPRPALVDEQPGESAPVKATSWLNRPLLLAVALIGTLLEVLRQRSRPVPSEPDAVAPRKKLAAPPLPERS